MPEQDQSTLRFWEAGGAAPLEVDWWCCCKELCCWLPVQAYELWVIFAYCLEGSLGKQGQKCSAALLQLAPQAGRLGSTQQGQCRAGATPALPMVRDEVHTPIGAVWGTPPYGHSFSSLWGPKCAVWAPEALSYSCSQMSQDGSPTVPLFFPFVILFHYSSPILSTPLFNDRKPSSNSKTGGQPWPICRCPRIHRASPWHSSRPEGSHPFPLVHGPTGAWSPRLGATSKFLGCEPRNCSVPGLAPSYPLHGTASSRGPLLAAAPSRCHGHAVMAPTSGPSAFREAALTCKAAGAANLGEDTFNGWRIQCSVCWANDTKTPSVALHVLLFFF